MADQMPEPEAAEPPCDPSPSAEHLSRYYELQYDPDAAARHLSEVLNLPNYVFEARSAVRLDYATYVFELAHQQQLGPIKTLRLLQISQNVLDKCAEGGSFDDSKQLLQDQLLSCCSPTSRPNDDTLSPAQIGAVGQFFAASFFRHYSLYSYMFQHEQDHTEYKAHVMIETPLTQPFDGVLTEAEWEAQRAARTAREAAEAAAAEQARAEAAAAAERAREEAVRAAEEAARQEELKRKPQTLEEAIDHLVAVRLDDERQVLAKDYKAREDELMARIAQLETTVKQGSTPKK